MIDVFTYAFAEEQMPMLQNLELNLKPKEVKRLGKLTFTQHSIGFISVLLALLACSACADARQQLLDAGATEHTVLWKSGSLKQRYYTIDSTDDKNALDENRESSDPNGSQDSAKITAPPSEKQAPVSAQVNNNAGKSVDEKVGEKAQNAIGTEKDAAAVNIPPETGLRQGPYEEWYESGVMALRGQYQHGLKEGYWYYYSTDGLATKKVLFAAGEPKRTIIPLPYDSGAYDFEPYPVYPAHHLYYRAPYYYGRPFHHHHLHGYR